MDINIVFNEICQHENNRILSWKQTNYLIDTNLTEHLKKKKATKKKISNLLSKSSKDIRFIWTPGYSNIKENEKADKEARNAIKSLNNDIIPLSSLVNIKKNINKYYNDLCNTK